MVDPQHCHYKLTNHNPANNNTFARWWVVRLDTGEGRRVCLHHIALAATDIGNPGDNYGNGWHIQPLPSK